MFNNRFEKCPVWDGAAYPLSRSRAMRLRSCPCNRACARARSIRPCACEPVVRPCTTLPARSCAARLEPRSAEALRERARACALIRATRACTTIRATGARAVAAVRVEPAVASTRVKSAQSPPYDTIIGLGVSRETFVRCLTTRFSCAIFFMCLPARFVLK